MAERKDLSRRQLLGASAGAGVVAALGLPIPPADAEQGAAGAAVRTTEELVLVNGRIHTMDGNNTIVDTVSIRNGRF
ncbi:MAG TPA: twin-arginine translocation signal domain-containing protein, partial [Vicinamibacterales bacterium]|nr:twin-arginine translocation signal domain-containing protein [Vicinamibacterales bacterium]